MKEVMRLVGGYLITQCVRLTVNELRALKKWQRAARSDGIPYVLTIEAGEESDDGMDVARAKEALRRAAESPELLAGVCVARELSMFEIDLTEQELMWEADPQLRREIFNDWERNIVGSNALIGEAAEAMRRGFEFARAHRFREAEKAIRSGARAAGWKRYKPLRTKRTPRSTAAAEREP